VQYCFKEHANGHILLTEKRAEIVGCFLLHFNGLELAVVNVDLQKVVAEKNIPFA